MTFPLPPPMRRALDLAREAAADGEVPVGAVVTRKDEILAEARNAMRGHVLAEASISGRYSLNPRVKL